MNSYCVTCLAWHSTDHRCSAYRPTSNWWALPSTPPLIAAPAETVEMPAVPEWASIDDLPLNVGSMTTEDASSHRRFFLMSGRRWGKTAAIADVSALPDDVMHGSVSVPDGGAMDDFVNSQLKKMAALPDDAPDPGESWPKDAMHDAARSIVHGAKRLVPQARQAVREAVDKADAPPTGRDAQDGALGRALGRRAAGYGLRVGQ